MRSMPDHEEHGGYADYEGAIALALAVLAFLLFGGFTLTFLTGLAGEMMHHKP